MNYEQSFMNDYRRYSNISSDYYKKGYQGVLNSLNASSPTVNTYLGGNMAHGGSYKGSMIVANQQRDATMARNRETASRSLLDMYLQGQRLAIGSKQNAMSAYQYEDSKPSFLEELGGFATGGLLQYATGRLLGGGDKSNNTLKPPNLGGASPTFANLGGGTNQYSSNLPTLNMMGKYNPNPYDYNPGGFNG